MSADNAGRERNDDRHDAPPDDWHRRAVDPQHVGVQHDFDRHERRIQHPVGEEEQRDRNGERGETVAQRAVHCRGEERDTDKRDDVRGHT